MSDIPITTSTFEVEGIRFMDIPHARDLVRECITEDFYELRSVHGLWNVFDLGACFGEFTLFARKLGHGAICVEPSGYSMEMILSNKRLNEKTNRHLSHFTPIRGKVIGGDENESNSPHYFRPNHPAGSGPMVEPFTIENVESISIGWLIGLKFLFDDKTLPVFVKIDIEGGELDLFKTVDWLDSVDAVSMETHNHDADKFGDVLKENGFKVKLTGTSPFPYPPWDRSMTGGRVIARR